MFLDGTGKRGLPAHESASTSGSTHTTPSSQADASSDGTSRPCYFRVELPIRNPQDEAEELSGVCVRSIHMLPTLQVRQLLQPEVITPPPRPARS
jgi:hypothetical protein